MNETVIVAADCATPLGLDAATTWNQLTSQRSGIVPITRFDPHSEPFKGLPSITHAGQLPCSYSDLAGSINKYHKYPEPIFHSIEPVCKRALNSIEFNISHHDPQRIAIIGGTALASQVSRHELDSTKHPYVSFLLGQCQNVPLTLAGQAFGFRGPCLSINSACASSGHAVFLACALMTSGVIDCALIIGHEFPLAPACVAGFDWLTALFKWGKQDDRSSLDPQSASRPFSIDRKGFVLAEGVAALFLTNKEYAAKMNWPIQGTILGMYSNSDGEHFTRSSTLNVASCITGVLRAAGLSPRDIHCISAHATSTPTGDQSELFALKAVFGEHLTSVPIMANKSQLGHSLGASFALQTVIAVNALRDGLILPTLHYVPDPSLPDAWICKNTMEHPLSTCLLNSFGFGGTNLSMLLGSA